MKYLICISTLLFSNSYAKEFLVKQRKSEVKVNVELTKEYEAKEMFLNTPLLIWNKKLKHHGPSIGVFPLAKISSSLVSSKAKKTNFAKFKSESTTNLRSLKATSIKYAQPEYSTNKVSYTFRYNLPGNIQVYSSETLLRCLDKGLKIKSVVKSNDYKKFKSDIDGILKSIKCSKN